MLYENYLVFCKLVSEAETGGGDGTEQQQRYQFKLSLSLANISVNTNIKGEDRKLELCTEGQGDVYILEVTFLMSYNSFLMLVVIYEGV